MKSSNYTIPKPCSEKWNTMYPTEKGAFCSICSKEVFDCSSLNSSDIKNIIFKVKDPCVKILKDQIEELNFNEWYTHLSLHKQLKYFFLFTVLSVFTEKTNASSSNLDSPSINTIELSAPENESNLIIGGLIITSVDSISSEFNENSLTAFSPYADLVLKHNKFAFHIENDSLFMNTIVSKEDSFELSIVHHSTNETVYTEFIHLPVGNKNIQWSLKDREFKKGHYTITLKNKNNTVSNIIFYF